VVIANVSAPDEISFTITTGLPATVWYSVGPHRVQFNYVGTYANSI